jgi:putative ABC transport system permease protein
MAAFVSIAILLAVIGIYGIISYDVEQRTREIAIRMALGAQRTSVIQLVLRRGMMRAGLGILFGIAASFGLTRFLASILYDTHPTDPATFIAVSAALAIVATCAGYLAIRRISSIVPMSILRRD